MRSASDVRENVDFRPAGEIEFGARRQEIEACLGKRRASFTHQPLIEQGAQLMEIAHVGRGIFLLRVVELVRPPIG